LRAERRCRRHREFLHRVTGPVGCPTRSITCHSANQAALSAFTCVVSDAANRRSNAALNHLISREICPHWPMLLTSLCESVLQKLMGEKSASPWRSRVSKSLPRFRCLNRNCETFKHSNLINTTRARIRSVSALDHHWVWRAQATASGEQFDPEGTTCAHKSAKFGSWLTIFNHGQPVTRRWIKKIDYTAIESQGSAQSPLSLKPQCGGHLNFAMKWMFVSTTPAG
jgi:hypothetical protein